MKRLVALAVFISLVKVQGSSIVLFREVLDNDHERENAANRVKTRSTDILTLTDDSIPLKNKDGGLSLSVDGRDEIITGKIQDELQNMETLENVMRFLQDSKDFQDCQGNTCNVCYAGLCLSLVYQAGSKQFEITLKYHFFTIFNLTFPAKDFQYCKKVSIGFIKGDVCVKISNVRISDSRACIDVTISALSFSQTFSNLCM